MRHIGPPSDQPYMAARSEPAASITARTSPIRSSIVCSATRSESPCPRLSKTITLAKAVSLFRRCSWLGTSHSNSTCERVPGISTMSRGPWPKMRYAMETSPLRAYLTGLSISAPLREISDNPSWLLSASLPQFVRANDLRFAPESGSSIRKDSASALPDDVACIADWFIASDVRLAQDVGLSEIAFALRNSRDGFTLWVENGAYRPRPVILFNVRCHADELVAALSKDRGRPTHFLLDLVNQHEVVIDLGRAQ